MHVHFSKFKFSKPALFVLLLRWCGMQQFMPNICTIMVIMALKLETFVSVGSKLQFLLVSTWFLSFFFLFSFFATAMNSFKSCLGFSWYKEAFISPTTSQSVTLCCLTLAHFSISVHNEVGQKWLLKISLPEGSGWLHLQHEETFSKYNISVRGMCWDWGVPAWITVEY